MHTLAFHIPRAETALKPLAALRTRLNSYASFPLSIFLVALAALHLITGCGSLSHSGNPDTSARRDRLSEDAFIEAANNSCAATLSGIVEMTVAERPGFSLRQILARAEHGLQELEAIQPPRGLARDFERFGHLLNRRYGAARTLVESAHIDEPKLSRVTSRYNRQTIKATHLARRLRIVDCPGI